MLETRGELLRLAAAFVEIDSGAVALPEVESFTPDTAEKRLRRLIGEVRSADHTMAADRVQEMAEHARLAETFTTKVPVGQRASLLRAVAEARQLTGWMMFDRGHRTNAERMFASARASAERAEALDLVAFVGGPNAAFMSTWTGTPARGAEEAYGALAWANRSGSRRLAAFVATMAARAHARMGEVDLCQRMLSTAEAELARHRAEEFDPDWLAVFDSAALAGHRGSCLLDLGKPRQAIAALREQEHTGPAGFIDAVAGVDRTLDYVERRPVTPRVVNVFRSMDRTLRTTIGAETALGDLRDRLRRFIAASD
ncbi:hypothetical protein [Nocardia otitidiscaviarum]|uniref:hypothetical protein n=1 Tax=Nocardia otitidiscaviarum TaxID=1823 RepID=UPI0024559CDF|nr:hypothetical protein [Nocardia otitidiscaviarum]